MSESNRIRTAIAVETDWAEVPTTGNLYVLSVTDRTGMPQFDTTESSTIRDDRQLRDIIKTMERAEGSLSFEFDLVSPAFKLFLEGVCYADRNTATEVHGNTNISFNGTTGVIAASAGTPFANLALGDYIRVTGAAEDENNNYFVITTYTSSTSITCAGQGLVTESAGAAVNVQGQKLKGPGFADKSFTIEYAFMDKDIFWRISGAMINSMSFSIPVDGIITGTIDFIAESWESLAGESLSENGLTLVDAPTAAEAQLMVGCTSIALIKEDGDLMTAQHNLQSIEFSMENNLEARYGIGKGRFATKIRKGHLGVSGNFEEDFETEDIITRSLGAQFPVKALEFTIFAGEDENDYRSPDVSAMTVRFPSIKYTSPDVNFGGQDEEATASNEFTAVASPAGSILFYFFPAITP